MSENWRITSQERAKHDAQFHQLNPKNGMITGQQARDLFLKSGLPQTALAKIWGLADVDGDGKMTPDEFSIAIFLITKKLQGKEIPNVLPSGLQKIASPTSTSPDAPPPTQMAPTPVSAVPASSNGTGCGVPPSKPKPPSSNSSTSGGISANRRVQFAQIFEQYDKNKTGFLTGAQARPLLLASGLSQTILAQIWGLADYDKNGKLNLNEFCVAMHLIEIAKNGKALPTKLPHELRLEDGGGKENQDSNNSRVNGKSSNHVSEDKTKAMEMERRKKEMAEQMAKEKVARELQERLEKERQAKELAEKLAKEKAARELAEQLAKEKAAMELAEKLAKEKAARELAEQMAKEKAARELAEKIAKEEAAAKAEEERRERLKREDERKKEMELEKQRQKDLEKEKEEQRLKMMAAREAARKEMEKQKEKEWIAARKKEMAENKTKEIEAVETMTIEHNDMVNRHQSLVEKAVQLVKDIEAAREKVSSKTSAIDKMREDRDEKVKKIAELKTKIGECREKIPATSNSMSIEELKESVNAEDNPVNQSYENVMKNLTSKRETVSKLRDEFAEVDGSAQSKTKSVVEMAKTVEILKKQIATLKEENEQLEADQNSKFTVVMEMKRKRDNPTPPVVQPMQYDHPNSAWNDNDVLNSNNGSSLAATWGSSDRTSGSTGFGDSASAFDDGNKKIVKYRAAYQFDSRNPDELNLQIGDVVLVDENQESDPGWLIGTTDGKTGLFPEAYVEKIEETVPVQNQPVSALAVDAWGTPGVSEPQSPGPMPAFAPETSVKAPPGMLVKALLPWQSKSENQLSFKKDDAIVVKEQQEAWWKGEIQSSPGVEGWFPSNYVCHVSPESSKTNKNNVTVRRAVALYAFQSNEPGDLTFDGEEIIVLATTEGDWWSGSIGNRSGIFPANYVSEIEPLIKSTCESKPDSGAVNKSGRRSRRSSVSGDSGRRSRRGSISGKISKDQEIAIVIAPYESGGSEQLALTVGQLVAIRKKMQSGWWEGELRARGKKRQIGWFPGDYVKILSTGAGGRSTSTTPTPEPVSIAAAAAAAAAATAGNTAATGSPQLESSPIENVIALYNYTANNDDELSFAKGNVIRIMSKDEVDWWKGELLEGGVDGMVIATGLFPANYVQSLNLPDEVGGIGSMTAPLVSCFVSCLDPKKDLSTPVDK